MWRGFFYGDPPMKYKKPSLTIEKQADKLITRGLNADRKFFLSNWLDYDMWRDNG